MHDVPDDAWANLPDPRHHPGDPDHFGPPTPAEERSGCLVTAVVVLVIFLAGFAIGAVWGSSRHDPEVHKTHQAVCEVLDQMGADDTTGHAREFCPAP